MEIEKLRELVLLNSGQYLIPFEATLMTDKHFINLAKVELEVYNGFVPYTEELAVNVTSGNEFYFETARADYKDAPNYLNDVRQPANAQSLANRVNQVVNMRNSIYPIPKSDGYRESLAATQVLNFTYTRPTLYVPAQGMYWLTAHFDRWIDVVESSDGEIDAVINHVSEEDYRFIQLVTARFMMVLGRSRRAFTIDGIPIQFDASEMVSDGEKLYDETLEVLQDTTSWADTILA